MIVNVSSVQVGKWDVFEVDLQGPLDGNPFLDISLRAVFKDENSEFNIEGFYDGNGSYKIRFMPEREGRWIYNISSNCTAFNGIEGEFLCVTASVNNHGPIRIKNTYHFAYEDGTVYIPIGTTCYAWTHHGDVLEEQTLETLEVSPFNKLRMCVFPKHYDYNHNEPEMYPFEGSMQTGWDYTRFNPDFFSHLEKRIKNLLEVNIEADLILFHPYDRWGFSDMGAEADDRYIRYIVARFAAYRNIWWSFANEYDLMPNRTEADWERYAKIVVEADPYQHLRSIHNNQPFYDHLKPWITHCSIQRQDVYKTSEYTDEWRKIYKKPIVIDECAYEGNINHGWGNITGQEMVRRFWEGAVRGGYVGHGETYMHTDDILWWSKGGKLYGASPERIDFLRRILEEGPAEGINPLPSEWDLPCGGVEGRYYLYYFGFNQPAFRTFKLPEGISFKVDIIDTWNMEITELDGIFEGEFKIELPGRQFMAVSIRRVQ